MSELKRCPFCGGKPEVEYCEWDCCKGQPRLVSCDCGGEMSGDKSCIERWNKRRTDGMNAWIEAEKDKLFDDVRGHWRMQALRDVQRQLNKLLNGLGINDE